MTENKTENKTAVKAQQDAKWRLFALRAEIRRQHLARDRMASLNAATMTTEQLVDHEIEMTYIRIAIDNAEREYGEALLQYCDDFPDTDRNGGGE